MTFYTLPAITLTKRKKSKVCSPEVLNRETFSWYSLLPDTLSIIRSRRESQCEILFIDWKKYLMDV